MYNKQILENMMKLKELRQQELNKKMNDGQTISAVVNDIRYLGKIEFIEEIDGQNILKERDVYLSIEDENGKITYRYYNEDLQLVAGEDSALGTLVPSTEFSEKDQTYLEKISEKAKEGISLLEIEAKVERIEKIAKALGISAEAITYIEEIDLEQEIEEDEEEQEQEKNQMLTKEQTASLNIRETTNLSENIKGETLGNKLGVNNIELPNGEKLTDGEKLARVDTSSLGQYIDNTSNMKDSFVIIRSNGEAVPIGEDILEPDTTSGNNSSRSDLTVNTDGSVDRETNTSSYKIVNGNGNEYLKVGYDEISGREIKYSQWSSQKGEYVSTELKTNRDNLVNDDTRQYLKSRNQGVREATETLERAEKHEDKEDPNLDVTLVDNDPNNDSHIHIDENDYIPNSNITWGKLADKLGIRGSERLERTIELYNKECSKDKYKDASPEEIIDDMEEEANNEYGMGSYPEHKL